MKISAFFAAFTFILALYLGLKDPKDRRIGEAWTKIESTNIRTITYTDEKKSVVIEPTGGTTAWVTLKAEGETQTYLAGSKVRDLYFAFSPIWATRKIGALNTRKKKEYGFDQSPASLRFELREGLSQEFLIGRRGFQSSEFFVMDKANQKVFLWNREPIDMIQDPARIAMKELQIFNPELINTIGIEAGDPAKARELIKSRKLWSERGKPLSLEDPVFDWLESLSTLKVGAYRVRPEAPSAYLMRLVVRLESLFDLKIIYDEKTKGYFLDFGPNRPQILLDTNAIEPLLAQWNEDKIQAKN